MPSDLQLKTMNMIHRTMLVLSGGRLGWEAGNMPVVELTTVGRKSGQPRLVMLTSPLQEDKTFVVVASRGGDDHKNYAGCQTKTKREIPLVLLEPVD